MIRSENFAGTMSHNPMRTCLEISLTEYSRADFRGSTQEKLRLTSRPPAQPRPTHKAKKAKDSERRFCAGAGGAAVMGSWRADVTYNGGAGGQEDFEEVAQEHGTQHEQPRAAILRIFLFHSQRAHVSAGGKAEGK